MQLDSCKILKGTRLEEGLSQRALAKRMGISQSTVSRREKRDIGKHSAASHKLRKYTKRKARQNLAISLRAAKKQLDEIWKKSGTHATAISKIIEAFAEVCEDTGRKNRSPD